MKRLLSSKALGLSILALVLLLTAFLISVTRFNFKNHFRGVYLLRGTGGYLFELKNDLFLGQGNASGKLIFGINLEDPRYKLFHRHVAGTAQRPHLDCIWDDDNGSGYVRSYLPGGREISTVFSRFIDDEGKPTHGLFVGGGLPQDLESPDVLKRNDTGMACYEGGRWYHVWCNTNEAIVSVSDGAVIFPSAWKYLGSGVRRESDTALEIWSAHEAVVGGVPLRIDRKALFRVGDTYFTLKIRITNTGGKPVDYQYCYGDEPWVGDWGDARGNVGWVRDRIVNTTGFIDTERYGYAGVFDYGNDLLDEGHAFTMASNFIEWFGPYRPMAYFSNGPMECPKPGESAPLQGDGRYIGLAWGPLTLLPGKTDEIVLAIGAAQFDKKTGMPSKPPVDVDYEREFAQQDRRNRPPSPSGSILHALLTGNKS